MGEASVIRAYWFGGDTLPNGDGRSVAIGTTHTVEPPIVPCKRGLHASRHVADALEYAKTAQLWLVDCGGVVVEEGDKLACSERTYIARIDATPILRAWARWCALQVAHLWDCPDVVRRYLETGDESLRAAARAAARAVAGAVAWPDASAAASAAAWAAAWDAAWDAAGAAARAAAGAAAWDAAGDAQRAKLAEMVEAAFEEVRRG